MNNTENIRKKLTEIAKKHHLHHYGDLEPAIEEMIIYINDMKAQVKILVNAKK